MCMSNHCRYYNEWYVTFEDFFVFKLDIVAKENKVLRFERWSFVGVKMNRMSRRKGYFQETVCVLNSKTCEKKTNGKKEGSAKMKVNGCEIKI